MDHLVTIFDGLCKEPSCNTTPDGDGAFLPSQGKEAPDGRNLKVGVGIDETWWEKQDVKD